MSLGLFFAGLLAFIVASTSQIISQLFFSQDGPPPYATCAEGLGALSVSLEEATRAAESPEEVDTALARFREKLSPSWRHFDGIRGLCHEEKQRLGLDALERLRYAEEHAVRRESFSLAALRRQVASALTDLPRESPQR